MSKKKDKSKNLNGYYIQIFSPNGSYESEINKGQHDKVMLFLLTNSNLPSSINLTSPIEESKIDNQVANKTNENPQTRPLRRKTRQDTYTVVKDLDLVKGKDGVSLQTFYNQYKADTIYEKNVLFVYYLKNYLGIEQVNVNHIFSCYKKLGVRLPSLLKQSILDTASRQGWLDTSTTDNIRLTVSGENAVEHDIKKADVKSE